MGTIAVKRQEAKRGICAFTSRKPDAYQWAPVHAFPAQASLAATGCCLTLLPRKDRVGPGCVAGVEQQTAPHLCVPGRAVAPEPWGACVEGRKLLTVVVNPVSPSVSMLLPQQQHKGALKSVKPTEKSNCFVDILLCASFLSPKQSEFTCFFVHLSGSSHEHPSQPCDWERAACLQLFSTVCWYSPPLLSVRHFVFISVTKSHAIAYACAFRSGFQKHAFRSSFHALIRYKDSICIVHFRLLVYV